VQQQLPSLIDPPILFAHRGARAHAPENTMDAFELALRLGATGLESDVWCTADGVAVLDHDGRIGRRFARSRSITRVRRGDLPAHIPDWGELFELARRHSVPVSLDIKGDDPDAIADAVLDAVEPSWRPHVWLCHPDIDVTLRLRERHRDARLVDTTRLHRIAEGPERRAARLADAGVDAINMRIDDWNGGLTTLFHRFGVHTLGWDLQHEHQLRPGLRMGLDGIFSDHVDRMVDVARDEFGPGV
jgi:glycerophosphoryl diester phosphodiesterase